MLELAHKYGLFIVEDATESLGSKYKGQLTGTFGEIGAFSFNGNKLITTGGGGMIVTKNSDLADRIKFLTTQARKGPKYYHTDVGYNYRLTNIKAALGLAQLESVAQFIDKRRAIAQYYQRELKNTTGITVCSEAEWAQSNYWLSYILVEADYGKSKDDLLKELNETGIEAREFFIPLHSLPLYQSYQAYQISNALNLYNKGVNLPSHIVLEEADLKFVVDTINNAGKNC